MRLEPSGSNFGADSVYGFWLVRDVVYPAGIAQRVVAVKIGDFEIPWPAGMTLVAAPEAWERDGVA